LRKNETWVSLSIAKNASAQYLEDVKKAQHKP
jgi:hypothetical protein